MVFTVLFLWLEPINISKRTQNTLHITLQQPQIKPTTPPKTIPKPKVEPKIEPKSESKTQAPPPTVVKQQPKQKTDDAPKPVAQNLQPTPTLSTGQILNRAKSYTNVQITDEFKAAHQVNFQQPTIKAHDPYDDIPYLPIHELAVDMNFYSAGYRGDIERFFDAVILTKTFTTKYGTKINCALAVIIVCGWK